MGIQKRLAKVEALLESRLDDAQELLNNAKYKGKLAAQDVRDHAEEALDEIRAAAGTIAEDLEDFFRKLPEVESNRSFTHRYVEFFVRLFEELLPGGLKLIRVPRWYAKLWNMPDSAYTRGKTVGYHVGHIAAIVLPLAVVGTAVAILV